MPRGQLRPERRRQLLERTVEIYQRNLVEMTAGREWLQQQRIGEVGVWERHRIGFADGTMGEKLPREGKLRKELLLAGVLTEVDEERFTGCVVVPVQNLEGEVKTLLGWQTAEEANATAVQLPETTMGFWNVGAARTHGHLLLVNSVLDALSVMMCGHDNCVAVVKALDVKGDELTLLADQGVNRITLVQPAETPEHPLLVPLQQVRRFTMDRLLLPGQQSPAEILRQDGVAKLKELLTQAPEGLKSTGAQAQSMADGVVVTIGNRRYEARAIDQSNSRLKATIRRSHAGRLHVDTVDLYRARQRRQLIGDVARVFGETPAAVEADVTKLIAHIEERPAAPLGEEVSATGPALTPAEAREAEALARSPDLFDRIGRDYARCGLIGEEANRLLAYLAMTSRKMAEPLSVLVLSSSGAGKTALQDATIAFAPPEDVVKVTSLSGKALFYKDRHSLRHKVLALEEGDGAGQADYAIRNLISARELVIETAVKDLHSGRLTTMENRVEGPTAVFITTTNPDTDPETKSRFIVTSIDESREQTRRILEHQRQRHTRDGLADRREIAAIRRQHHNLQRWLKPVNVINPFADQLGYGDDRLQGRRDQPKYLNLIAAVAFLRQAQKGPAVLAAESIEVDREDIRIGHEVATAILGRRLDELSRPGRDLLRELEAMAGRQAEAEESEGLASQGLTRREIREHTGWSNTRVHRYLRELVDLEYVVQVAGRNGVLTRYRLLHVGQDCDGEQLVAGLTDPEELS